MSDWHKQRLAQAAAEADRRKEKSANHGLNHHTGNVSGRAHRKKMERSLSLLPEAEECMQDITERLNKLKEMIENDDGNPNRRDMLSLINSSLYRYTLYEEKRDRGK